jgi:hypothetical protein
MSNVINSSEAFARISKPFGERRRAASRKSLLNPRCFRVLAEGLSILRLFGSNVDDSVDSAIRFRRLAFSSGRHHAIRVLIRIPMAFIPFSFSRLAGRLSSIHQSGLRLRVCRVDTTESSH